jgi:UDP-glucose 6-dehydrogenase
MIGDIANNTPGANAQDILHAISDDSRIGAKYLNFGYGYGGPCFPRDNRALGNYAASIGIDPLIPRATDKSNQNHCEVMVERFLKEDKAEVDFRT